MRHRSRGSIPLDADIVEAACRLHARMDYWRNAEAALDLARDKLMGFGPAETLAKVVLVNALYYTNVFAVTRVADWFTAALHETNEQDWSPGLIERMAIVQLGPHGGPRRLISLASKFAHFFMDSQRFPIYDEFAKRTLAMHTGEPHTVFQASYEKYCTAYEMLAHQVNMTHSPRKLDRYLWVQGQFEMFKSQGSARSKELEREFRANTWPPKIGPPCR